MATVLVSVRLSPALAAALDRAGGRLECSPSRLVEALLERSEPRREDILKVAPPGPFSEKRNLRLSPQAMEQLTRLVGDAIEPSVFIRYLLADLFSSPERAWLFEDQGPDTARPKAERPTGRVSRVPPRVTRTVPVPRGHPLVAFLVLLFILLLPLLVEGLHALITWLNDRRASARPRPQITPSPPEEERGKRDA